MLNQNAIMAVVNQSYIPHLKTMWASLFISNPYDIDFYLFYEDIASDEIDELRFFSQNYSNAHIVFMPISSKVINGLPTTAEFPKEIYFKLLGLDLLPKELHQILCMDLDMIVKKDISDIFRTDVSAHGLGACPDVFGVYYGLEENNLNCLGLSHNPAYFNAGFMLFSLDFIRQIGGGKAIVNLAHMHADKLYYPEQDILNIIFHDSYLQLPWQEYNCPPLYYIFKDSDVASGNYRLLAFKEISSGNIPNGYLNYTQSIYENAGVIHYMGGTKPWKENRDASPIYEIFDTAYKKIAATI